MPNYKIKIRGRRDLCLNLNYDSLSGIIAMCECYFGIDRDENVGIIDNYGYKVECDEILEEIIAYDGEGVSELEPSHDDWSVQAENLANEHGCPCELNKKYSVVFTGLKTFLARFDSIDFISGVYGFHQWINTHPEEHLKYFHMKNRLLEMPRFECVSKTTN